MSIEIYNAKSNDFILTYYFYHILGKIKTNLTYSIGGTFEANKIIENIYLGGIDSANDLKNLKNNGITHIISVISGFVAPYPNDFNYLIINALDTENTDLKDFFDITNKFINDAIENNGNILIHCMAGRSRSVTILAAYIIKKYGLHVKNTLLSIKNKRNIIEPNKSFVEQLDQYYKLLYID